MRITDAALHSLSKHMTTLISLINLHGCFNIKSAALHELDHMTALTSLSSPKCCNRITDSGPDESFTHTASH